MGRHDRAGLRLKKRRGRSWRYDVVRDWLVAHPAIALADYDVHHDSCNGGRSTFGWVSGMEGARSSRRGWWRESDS